MCSKNPKPLTSTLGPDANRAEEIIAEGGALWEHQKRASTTQEHQKNFFSGTGIEKMKNLWRHSKLGV